VLDKLTLKGIPVDQIEDCDVHIAYEYLYATKTIGYTYDNAGRRLTMTVPGQSTVGHVVGAREGARNTDRRDEAFV
jgi:hypothetical protein